MKRTLGISFITMGALGAALAFTTPALAANVVPAASATATTVFPKFNIPFDAKGTGCEGVATITEGHDSNGAYVSVSFASNPCNTGVEPAICSPDRNTSSYGPVIHFFGEDSKTGYIATNSGNHHGIRWWTGANWQTNWID